MVWHGLAWTLQKERPWAGRGAGRAHGSGLTQGKRPHRTRRIAVTSRGAGLVLGVDGTFDNRVWVLRCVEHPEHDSMTDCCIKAMAVTLCVHVQVVHHAPNR